MSAFTVCCFSTELSTDYFNSNQIGRPSTSNLHHSSSWTDASSSHSASTTSEPSEPVLPLKRRFHDMNSPSQENDYSPARTRPKKRQRILHTSDVNDPDNHFAEFPTVLIRNLKPFDNSVSKNHFLPSQSQDPIHKRDASQHSASSDLSCSSLPSRACLSSPSVTIQSFPRIDLRRTLSLNRDSPLKLKILTPLLIRWVCSVCNGQSLIRHLVGLEENWQLIVTTQVQAPSLRFGTKLRKKVFEESHLGQTRPKSHPS